MMRKLFITLFLAACAAVSYAQDRIQVQVHRVVSSDEQFNVTFIIEGGDRPSGFTWNHGEDFLLVWGPQQGRSTSVQIINGKRTQSTQTTYSYVLKPTKAGKFVIPGAVAKVKGREITSEPVEVEVLASMSSSSDGSGQDDQNGPDQTSSRNAQAGIEDDDIVLSVDLDRTDVVVGEPIIATIKLYRRVGITGLEGASYPTFNGFWSQQLEAPKGGIEFVRESYGGKLYDAAQLGKYVLIPQQKGQLRIEPAEIVCLVNVRVSSGGASIFDGFFDEYRTVRKKVTSRPLVVNVSSLPSGAPASFAGGVGEYAISASLSKDSLKTHEAASLIVTVSGKGNVALLEMPKVKFPADMEVYDTKVTGNVSKNGLSGSKRYEYPFIPRSHGEFVIEPIKYSYYDVRSKKYVTLETAPIRMEVAKGNDTGSAGTAMPVVARNDVKSLDSDIRFISTKNPGLKAKGRFFVGSALFWVIVALVLVLGAAVYAVMRKVAARRADIAGTKTRKATKMALKRLRKADELLKQNLHSAFYEELHKALLGFISDKLAVPVAELSHDRICSELSGRGVPEDAVSSFIAMLDACEFARYAPEARHEEMAAHFSEAAEVISSIDSNMKSGKNISRTAALALVLMLAIPSVSFAQGTAMADSLWNESNNAYSQGQWAEAITGYRMIEEMGFTSAPLYCNMGNSFFKDGDVPMAILYYEKALKLDPSYSDARTNLELMNSRIYDRIDPVPEFFLGVWMKRLCYVMDSDSWAVAFIVLLCLSVAMLLLFLLSGSVAGRRTGFFTGLAMILLAASALSFSIWQKNDCMRADAAIVMKPVVTVKSSPSAEASKDLFILHEGTKVKILDTVGEWNNVALADGRQGWLPSGSLGII